MTEEIGRIERPEAGDVAAKRKLYVVPLVYTLPGAPDGYRSRLESYWSAVDTHLSSLESRAGIVRRIFHEGISYGGDPGVDQLKKSNIAAYPMINTRLRGGATLEALDDDDLFTEVVDWGRILQIGFASRKVAERVQDAYTAAADARLTHIGETLSEKVGESEAGLVVISSLQGINIPQDIEIFNIIPPELDQLNRWLEEQARLQQAELERAAAAAQASQSGQQSGTPPPASPDDGPRLWTPGSR